MNILTKKPKITLIFDRRKKATESRPGVIEIQVYYENDKLRISTGIKVLPSQWKNDCVIKHENSIALNQTIMSQIEELKQKIASISAEGKDFSLKMLKGTGFVAKMQEENKMRKEAEKAGEVDFFFWLQTQIKNHPVRESTRRQHNVMLAKLKEFGEIRSFADLTTAKLKKWDTWLHKKNIETQSSPKQSTVHGYHKRFKTYVREALELGLIDKNPYTPLHISRGKSAARKYLTENERNAIEALELTGSDCIARDLFIFACYTGLAYSDVEKISKADVKHSGKIYYIEDTRTKTDSKYKITLLPKALAILKKYKYNLKLLSAQKINIHLKTIAAKAKINMNLTFHVGRHTFATWALKSGVPIEQVSKMLAHADIATTQIYAKVLQEEVDKGFELLRSKC